MNIHFQYFKVISEMQRMSLWKKRWPPASTRPLVAHPWPKCFVFLFLLCSYKSKKKALNDRLCNFSNLFIINLITMVDARIKICVSTKSLATKRGECNFKIFLNIFFKYWYNESMSMLNFFFDTIINIQISNRYR